MNLTSESVDKYFQDNADKPWMKRAAGLVSPPPLAAALIAASREPGPTAQPNKHHARRTVVDGISFHSKKEAAYYQRLKLECAATPGMWFIRQPKFDTGGGTTYAADFLVCRPAPIPAYVSQEEWEQRYFVEVVDVKGQRLPAFIRSKKQVEAAYPIKIIEA